MLRWWTGLLVCGLLLAACGSHGAPDPAAGEPAGTTLVPTSTTLPPTTTSTTSPSPTTTAPVPEPAVPVPATTTTTLPAPVALEPGAQGDDVVRLQQAMAAAGFFRDEVDGVFGERTAAAVVAAHKALDLPRTSSWAVTDWSVLGEWTGPALPARDGEPDRVEVDLTRQLLYRLEGGRVADIIPVSTGNGALYENAAGSLVRARTPRGDFAFYKQYDGWRISYLGGLYRPWYFRGGYAIHGSSSVPAAPASHGCIRVPIWEADHLFEVMWIGLPVHVWD